MSGHSQIKSSGFTIIELMIATTVFSVILLICTSGLIQIGRIYQKGVIDNQTQEVARSIMVNIAEAIQFSGGTVTGSIVNAGTSPNASSGFCIDNKRYSYLLDRKLVDSVPTSDQSNRALLVDIPSGGCSSATSAQNLFSSGVGNELLSPNMRLLQLTICSPGSITPSCPTPPPANSNLYQVTIKLGYGDGDLFVGGNCISNRIGGSFCSTSYLSTTIQKRIIR